MLGALDALATVFDFDWTMLNLWPSGFLVDWA